MIGFAIAFRRTARAGLYGVIGITIVYIALGTWLVPRLWADPLGPMLKIWPILVLHLVALASEDSHSILHQQERLASSRHSAAAAPGPAGRRCSPLAGSRRCLSASSGMVGWRAPRRALY